VPLIRPVEEEADLRNLENISSSNLRPEFLRQVNTLRSNVFSRCKVKSLNNTPVTGAMLLTLAESYVEAINRGDIPNIEGSWVSICKSECLKVISECLEIYMRGVKEQAPHFPVDSTALKDIHEAARTQAINYFYANGVGTEMKEFEAQLNEDIKVRYKDLKRQNDRVCAKECEEKLSK
jgi:hypothetical protein